MSNNSEYIEFRDGLYDPKYSIEKHTHHAYYDDNGVLSRKCALCHGDLWDATHIRETDSARKD